MWKDHEKYVLGNTWECETVNKKEEMKMNVQERSDCRKT